MKDPAKTMPASEGEKNLRAAGIGKASGYWGYADAHRRAMSAPMSDNERSQLTTDPIMVFPSGQQKERAK